MNPRRNRFRPIRDAELSGSAIIFSLAIVVLWAHGGTQCRAVNLPSAQYNVTRIVCKDKLSEWQTDSRTQDSEAPPNGTDGWPPFVFQPNGVVMRGTWRQAATSSSSIFSEHAIRAPFLLSDQGMFDFFSAQWTEVVGEENPSPAIQNISGQIFFRDTRDHGAHPGSILLANGVYNSKTGELCLLGCVQTPLTSGADSVNVDRPGKTNSTTTSNTFSQSGLFFGEDTSGCIVRGLLTISTSSKAGRKRSQGVLESLKSENQDGHFSEVKVLGSMVNNEEQKAVYHFDVFVRSLIYAVEAVIVAWQIAYTTRSPSGHLVSILMILSQIAVMMVLAVKLVYLPIHLMTFQRLKYLISSVAIVPWLVFFVVILLNGGFFWVVLKKRRTSTQRLKMNWGEENFQEWTLPVLAVCTGVYTATGVVLWTSKGFVTYMQVVWCWIFLPQVVVNMFWDVRGVEVPLHWVYVVGVSLCRVVYIGFNAVRPTIYGYDDLSLFPQGWFWGVTGTVLVFASCTLLQQRYGGRSCLPQGLFGYQQLHSLDADTKRGESKAEDAFDL